MILGTECLAAVAHDYWWLAVEVVVDGNGGSEAAVFNTTLSSQDIINTLNDVRAQELRSFSGNVQEDTSKEAQENDRRNGHQGPENVGRKFGIAENEAGSVQAETAHEPWTGFPEDAAFDKEARGDEDGDAVDEVQSGAEVQAGSR